MTRDEALKLLRGGKEGVQKWNEWREENPKAELPSLRYANLVDVDLRGADLRGADLANVNLGDANLSRAHLSRANLGDADLHGADLRGAKLYGADLHGAGLRGADLRGAKLHGAHLRRADLCGAKLHGAHLRRADLFGALLFEANLCDANLRHAHLSDANMTGANMTGATLAGACFLDTVVATDISAVNGLDDIIHLGPSPIDVASILRFKDDLPEKFLRGCGLQEKDIAYFRSRVGSAVRYYSCFISYSTADEEFASRLHNDFQEAGIRCWKWDHDARTGKSLWGEIDQAIRVHEKLVLIASESSLKSPAVNREIERAIRREDQLESKKAAGKRDGETDVLFPVRVDDFIFRDWEHERKVDVTKKVVADARGWDTDPAVYAKVRDRLIRDLKPG